MWRQTRNKNMDFFLQGELCSESDDASILECEYRHGDFQDDDYESISLYRRIKGKRIWGVVGEGGPGLLMVCGRRVGCSGYGNQSDSLCVCQGFP